jgi:hypothetical protein
LNKEKEDSLNYTFETVRCEIRELNREKIRKGTANSFYYGEGDPKFNTVTLINK